MKLEQGRALVPLDRLLEALWGNPFDTHNITEEMVWESLRFGTYSLASEAYGSGPTAQERSPEWHAQRVAYLVRYGWDDPIAIDVGIPTMGFFPYPLTDGHHRVCAAIIRGDKEILAEISGDVKFSFELFGVVI